jgi:hypothetical protein
MAFTNEAGVSMQQVPAIISKVGQTMREQSIGIAEINQALDSVT